MGVRVEMPSNQPIVLLREVAGDRYLPIWIGAVEATAAAFPPAGRGRPPPPPPAPRRAEGAGDRSPPVWVGAVEATAIAFAQQGVVPPRPLTHDLMKDLLSATGNDLTADRITRTKGGVLYR